MKNSQSNHVDVGFLLHAPNNQAVVPLSRAGVKIHVTLIFYFPHRFDSFEDIQHTECESLYKSSLATTRLALNDQMYTKPRYIFHDQSRLSLTRPEMYNGEKQALYS